MRKNMNKKIIILDYSSGEVYIKNYDDGEYLDAEDFLINEGFDPEDCNWMIMNSLNVHIQ